MDSYLIPVLLGVVEGLTEFIPVSSTGHLILFGEALEYRGPAAATFDVFIQLGAILAVVFLYPGRFLRLLWIGEKSHARGFAGSEGIKKLLLGCLPAFVLGFLLHGTIKEFLFSPLPVALALFVGGVALIFLERHPPAVRTWSIEDISYRQSILIGCFQVIALWPGFSRSGATIMGGLIVGLPKAVAAEFSFLLAVPVMFAATLYDLYKSWSALEAGAFDELAVGFVVSFFVAIIAIRTFMGFLKRYPLTVFGYYRIVLAAVVVLILQL